MCAGKSAEKEISMKRKEVPVEENIVSPPGARRISSPCSFRLEIEFESDL